eukprot:jgi/Pico_ML_1/52409/g3116.t1
MDVYAINSTAAVQLPAKVTSGYAGDASLAVYRNTPYVAFRDGDALNLTTVKKFTGDVWESVGAAGAVVDKEVRGTVLAINDKGVPYIAYDVVNRARDLTFTQTFVKVFQQSAWTLLGNVTKEQIVTSRDLSFAFDAEGNPYVGLCNFLQFEVKKHVTGQEWKPIDTNDLGCSSSARVFFTGNDEYQPTLASIQPGSEEGTFTVLEWDETSWNPVGPSMKTGSILEGFAMAGDNTPYALFYEPFAFTQPFAHEPPSAPG